MRGKGATAKPLPRVRRITPAHAGKSLPSRVCRRRAEDHPRPCGEKTLSYNCFMLHVGSPPPMRGKGYEESENIFREGITPAHAGKGICVQ